MDVIEVIAEFMAGRGAQTRDDADDLACALQDYLEEAGWVLRPRPTIAVELIDDERRRQVEVHGWTEEHDAQHPDGDLALAAWSYLTDFLARAGKGAGRPGPGAPAWWPWHGTTWKPTPGDPLRQLTKAAALIAAEMDRLMGQ